MRSTEPGHQSQRKSLVSIYVSGENMSRIRSLIKAAVSVSLLSLLITGCLVSEKKEYVFRVEADGSGSGSVKYINLVSQNDDGKDVSFKDFAELVTDYIEGDKFLDENPAWTIQDKKLYEKDGVLVGEVSFTFTSWDSAGFLRTKGCACCPTFYYLEEVNNESYESSNGTNLKELGKIPLVAFDAGTKEFRITTTQLTDLSDTSPLLPHYKNWKK